MARILVVSFLAATSGFGAEQSSAPVERGNAVPLALQITGAVLAGLGSVVALAAAGSDEMGSDVAFTEGLLGIGVGAALFTAGTVWRSNRSSATERSAGRPTASLEVNLIGSAPGLIARAVFWEGWPRLAKDRGRR